MEIHSQTWNTAVFFLVLTILLYYIVFSWRKKKYNLPPGPYPFPIIGSIIQIARINSKMPMVAVQKLGKKYGPIISLQMGSVSAVGINGFDAIKELETNPDFINRSNDKWLINKSLGLSLGLVLSESDFWSNTRTNFHRLIKDYGFGKREQMYNLIMEELTDFVKEWKAKCEANNNGCAKIEINNQFQVVFLNVIWSLVTGDRFYSHEDPKLQKLSNLATSYFSVGQFANGIIGLFPKLLYMFPSWTGYDKHLEISKELYEFFDEIVQERIELGQYKDSPSNFIDSFLQLIEENNEKNLNNDKPDLNSLLDSIYTKANLIAVLQDLCIAGNDTTANTLNFIIRYLVQNPKVQDKLHEEIDRVIGHNRLVRTDDKSNLIYTQAVIFEGLRISCVAPTVPRRAIQDSKFWEFDIPKNTILLPNWYGTSMDELVWENPETFRPERFLNSSQTELINTEKILTFGIGKRNCIGENIAKSSLFLVLTTLFQQFYFEVDPDFGIPSLNTIEAITRNTESYNIIIRQKY